MQKRYELKLLRTIPDPDPEFKKVVIRFPGMHVFFILLCHAWDMDITFYLDMGTKKINFREKAKEFGKEWPKIQLGVYVFTGEDCVNVFKGKIRPFKKLTVKFHSAFSKHDKEWIVPKESQSTWRNSSVWCMCIFPRHQSMQRDQKCWKGWGRWGLHCKI